MMVMFSLFKVDSFDCLGEPYNIITNGGFIDVGSSESNYAISSRYFQSYLLQPKKRIAPTFDLPSNTWSTKSGSGETLDYIFAAARHRPWSGVRVEEFQTKDFKTESGISLSDHSAVLAIIKMRCLGPSSKN